MAKIIFAAPIESMKGKLGGSTVRKTRSGHILTPTVRPAQRNTAPEAFIRGHLNRITGDWYTLTDLQRQAWTKYASMLDGPLTGFNVFVRHNTRLLNANNASLTQISNAPFLPSTPDVVRGLAANTSGGTNTITWTSPDSGVTWVQVQYSPQVGFSMSGKRRWVLLPAVVSTAKTTDHVITLPHGYSMYYRARSIDNRGRVSPWTTDALTTAQEEPWLEGYAYRRKIHLSAGSPESGTDYEVKLAIGQTSGASGEDFDLDGHAQNFGTDLRFTSSDKETLLHFWRKEITGSPPNQLATVRVQVTDDLTSPQSIYCYYGKPGAADASSGPNTYHLFQDFSNTPNGDPPVGWTVAVGTWQVTDAILYCPSTDSSVHKVYYPHSHGLTSYVFHAELAVIGVSTGNIILFYKEADAHDNRRLASEGSDQTLRTESGDHLETQARGANSQWYQIEFRILASGNRKTYYTSQDAGLPETKVHDQNDTFSGTPGIIGLGDYATNSMFRNVRVRKFAATEPAFTSADAEETP